MLPPNFLKMQVAEGGKKFAIAIIFVLDESRSAVAKYLAFFPFYFHVFFGLLLDLFFCLLKLDISISLTLCLASLTHQLVF